MMPGPMVRYLEAAVQLPIGEEAIWSAICALHAAGSNWSLADIERQSGAQPDTIREYLRRLLRAGRVEHAGSRPARPPSRQVEKLYGVARLSLDAPRLRRDGSECPEPVIEKLWRVIRIVHAINAGDLAEATGVKPATAERYLRHLAVDGGPLQAAPGRPLERTYSVLRQLGPRAPKILSGHVVYDPNARALLGDVHTEEVSP